MTFEVLWIEVKKDGWKIASIKEVIEGGQTINDVSINKVDKKGREFPNFDALAAGHMIAGNLWLSPVGKYTLFAPDPKPIPAVRPASSASSYGGGRPSGGIPAAQARKAEGIKEAQENKGKGIMVSAAMRDSTTITTTIVENSPEQFGFIEFQELFARVKAWYLKTWKETEDAVDLPF